MLLATEQQGKVDTDLWSAVIGILDYTGPGFCYAYKALPFTYLPNNWIVHRQKPSYI